MDHTRKHMEQNTTILKDQIKTITITDPFHPFYGQTANVVRMRKGHNACATVELSNGKLITVKIKHTNLGVSSIDGITPAAKPLLDIDGLLNIVKIINQCNSKEEGRVNDKKRKIKRA